jgi:hypothetical protein
MQFGTDQDRHQRQVPEISNKPKVVASYSETVENEATANEAAAEDETTSRWKATTLPMSQW